MTFYTRSSYENYYTLYFFALLIFFITFYVSYVTIRDRSHQSIEFNHHDISEIENERNTRELAILPVQEKIIPQPTKKIYTPIALQPPVQKTIYTLPPIRYGPDFLFFGNVRCGTASFYDALRHHPQIVAPENKDINFWANMDERRKGVQAYHQSYFPPRTDSRMYGDGSTSAIACPGTATTLQRQYPNLKLIAAFRHPVDRAFSHYQACMKNPQNAFLFEFDSEMHRQIEHLRSCEGKYATEKEKLVLCYGNTRRLCQWNKSDTTGCMHIVLLGLYPILTQEWVSVFPRDRFFTFDMHEFYEDGQRILDDTFQFLGLTTPTTFSERSRWASVHINENTDVPTVSPEAYDRGMKMLYDYYLEMNIIFGESYRTGIE